MNSFKKFKEEFPSKKQFYSSLRGKRISDKEYERTVKVQDRFEKETMKNYHDLALKCDVLFLADVFLKIINISLKNYALCLCHYLIASDLSWDKMVNKTKVQLELISDTDMYWLFEKGMRDGVSYIVRNIVKPKISI